MRLLLLAVLGLAVLADVPARAASVNEVPDAGRQKKKKKRASAPAGSGVSGTPSENDQTRRDGDEQASGPAAGTNGADPFPGTKYRVYEGGVPQMDHPQGGSHGIMVLTKDRYQGASVAFTAQTTKTHILCARGQSPAAPSIGACQFTHWISRAPGGAPVSKSCMAGPFMSTIASSIEALGVEHPAKGPGQDCRLTPGNYYCNIRATGWDHPEQPAQTCGGLVASPMVQAP